MKKTINIIALSLVLHSTLLADAGDIEKLLILKGNDYLQARDQLVSVMQDNNTTISISSPQEKVLLLNRIIKNRMDNPILCADIDQIITKSRLRYSKLSDNDKKILIHKRVQDLAGDLIDMWGKNTDKTKEFALAIVEYYWKFTSNDYEKANCLMLLDIFVMRKYPEMEIIDVMRDDFVNSKDPLLSIAALDLLSYYSGQYHNPSREQLANDVGIVIEKENLLLPVAKRCKSYLSGILHKDLSNNLRSEVTKLNEKSKVKIVEIEAKQPESEFERKRRLWLEKRKQRRLLVTGNGVEVINN